MALKDISTSSANTRRVLIGTQNELDALSTPTRIVTVPEGALFFNTDNAHLFVLTLDGSRVPSWTQIVS